MNGQEGFETALEWIPDLIISDLMMPVVSGFEFRRLVLKEPTLSAIPFLFLTAKSGEDDIATGQELGVAGFVVKTEGPKVLVSKVNSILGFND